MPYKPDIHHRHSIRLKEFDYSSDGAYFVTICTLKRECMFGDVVDGEMRLNEYGQVVTAHWNEIPHKYQDVGIGEFIIIMPNHFHGIITINNVGAIHELPLPNDPYTGNWKQRRKMLLPKVVGWFKMNTAKEINKLRDNPGCPVWQRNYYEHVIRNDDDLNRIREYIINNPMQWELDENNPANISVEFMKGIIQGLNDLEEGREISLDDVKKIM